MIQRVQSLYLLVALAAYISLFFFPFAEYSGNDTSYALSVLGLIEGNTVLFRTVPLLTAVIFLIFLVFSIIFMYKKRILQIRMIAISVLINIALIAGMFLYSDNFSEKVNTAADFGVASYIVLVPLVFLVLANRAIKKDELRVRAADRLR